MTWHRQYYPGEPEAVSSGPPSQPSHKLKAQRVQRRWSPSGWRRPPHRGQTSHAAGAGAGHRGSGLNGAVRVSMTVPSLGSNAGKCFPIICELMYRLTGGVRRVNGSCKKKVRQTYHDLVLWSGAVRYPKAIHQLGEQPINGRIPFGLEESLSLLRLRKGFGDDAVPGVKQGVAEVGPTFRPWPLAPGLCGVPRSPWSK